MEVNGVSINDNVLSEILVCIETVIMWGRWLVNRPIVERWVNNWIVGFGLNQIITIDTIDDNISKVQVLVTCISMVMRNGWLVYGPVIEWWINNWVLRHKL